MNTFSRTLLGLSAALTLSLSATAQAPAAAPAGSNGICKDGTYSTAASKDGACRGHKGVQTWYSAATTTKKGAPAAAATPASTPAAQTPPPARGAARPQPQPASTPAPQLTPAPAQTRGSVAPPAPAPQQQSQPTAAAKPGISAERAKLTSMQPAAGGGPGLVWVNGSSKVYHCSGSEFYGKTKTGSYMSESDAKAKGAHADHNKPCS